MKQTVNLTDFQDAFRDYGRKENFSYEGLEILYNYFEEIDPEMELDVIAICCDYYEDGWENIAREYDIELEDDQDEDEKKKAVKEYLGENTSLIGETADGSFIYQAF